MKTIFNLLFHLMILVYFITPVRCQMVTTLLGPDQYINDGITFDEEGNLYGSDHAGYGVYKYTIDDELILLATFDNHPNGIVLDDENNLYVSVPQENKIYVITEGGDVSQYGPEISNPNGLIFEYDSDTLLVTSYAHNTLTKLSSDGIAEEWINSGDLNGPLGLCYDDDNVLYVSNFNDGKMFKVIDDELEYFATIPGANLGSSYFSTGYIIWFNGYVYATGYATNIVYRVDEDGNIENYAGSGVFGFLDGEASSARFEHPNGIAKKVNSEEIYISGYESHAVRIISESTQGMPETERNGLLDMMYYPNPTSNNLIIKSGTKFPITKVEIYTMQGNLVRSYCFESNPQTEAKIDMCKLSPASYLVKAYHKSTYDCGTIILY